MLEPRISARKEAAPIAKWEELFPTQRNIIVEIHEWLTDFLSREHQADIPGLGEPVTKSFLPSIDHDRRNNVLLLNGARGTGKTTLLLTLLQMWKDALQDDAEKAETQIGFDKKVTSILANRRVVPLPILDLQPLGKHHSLILQLAGRLYPVVAELGGLDGTSPYDCDDCDSQQCLPRTRWLDFVQAVAIGHEDNPRKRLASSNPEDFALELATAERRQMDIGTQWARLVDSLADRLHQKSVSGLKDRKDPCKVGKDPCFLIPIDDADMNAERGVELIELLRSLWHPRVVFLLTGDSDLLRHLLFNHYKKVCKRLPDTKASQLAADVLDKVIPIAQRWRCKPSEPIGYRFLCDAGVLPSTIQDKVKAASLESAFPRRWRVLRDLEQTLRAQHLDAVGMTRVLFEEALRDSFLSSEEQAHLLTSCIRRTRRGQGLHVNENVVRMRPVSNDRDSLTIDVVDKASRRAISWNSADDDRWFFRKTTMGDAAQDDPEDLPEEIVHALYLAASCASEPREKDVANHVRLGRSLSPRDYDLISSQFCFDRIHYEFPWPMPDWHDPIPFLCFVRAWRGLLADRAGILSSTSRSSGISEKQQDALEMLAAYWLGALCELGESGSIPRALPTTPASQDAWQELWRSLGARIAELAKSPDSPGTQRGALIDWAQTDAMFFASKESGLRLPTRKVLTDGWMEAMCPLIAGEVKDARYWELVGQVMGGRVQRIQRASADQGPIVDQIKQARPHIRARSLSSIFQNEVTADKPIPSGMSSVYEITNPPAAIALLLDGMDPHASGLLERLEPISYLFPGQYTTDSNRQEHFREQVCRILSKAKLSSLPMGLNEQWKSLWIRIRDGFDHILANMASKSSLLWDISNLDARDSNRVVLRLYVQMEMPSFATEIETEMDRVDHSYRQYLTPSVISQEVFKTQFPETDPASFSLLISKLIYKSDLSESLSRIYSPMIINTVVGLLSILRDIVVDQNDGGVILDIAPLLSPFYVTQFRETNYIIPIPKLLCHYDNRLFASAFEALGNILEKLTNQIQPQAWIAGFLLSSVLLIRDSRYMDFYPMYMHRIEQLGRIDPLTDKIATDADERFWIAHRKLVRAFYDPPLSGHRAAVVREWANLAGPLFAAPETGMSSDSASKWLQAWDGTDNSIDNPAIRARLSEFRLKRAQASLGSEATLEQAKESLKKVDDANPNHAWVKLIERR